MTETPQTPDLTITRLFNRIFETYNEIVDHYCDAWNKLISTSGRIMSIGRHQWA